MDFSVFRAATFLLLLFLSKNACADIVGAYVLKNPVTGQQVTLLGDVHICSFEEQGDYICSALQDLVVKNPETQVFYEGYRHTSKYPDLEDKKILRRITDLFKENKLNFIDIENRDFHIPLAMIDVMLSVQMVEFCPEAIARDVFNDEVLGLYESFPLYKSFSLFIKECHALCQKMDKHEVEVEKIKSDIGKQLDLMIKIFNEIKSVYSDYLEQKIDDLIVDELFCKLYRDYCRGVPLLPIVLHYTFPLIELNCLFRIIEQKENCIVLTGYAHTEAIAHLLMKIGFESLLTVNLKSSSTGEEYSSLTELEAAHEEDDKPLLTLSENERKQFLLEIVAKRYCPLSLETLKEIFAYGQSSDFKREE